MANWEEYTKMLKEEYDFLDSIFLDKYIKDGINIYDIKDAIEKDYAKKRPENVVFNYMGTDEFLDYLTKRYNLTYREEINYYIYHKE